MRRRGGRLLRAHQAGPLSLMTPQSSSVSPGGQALSPVTHINQTSSPPASLPEPLGGTTQPGKSAPSEAAGDPGAEPAEVPLGTSEATPPAAARSTPGPAGPLADEGLPGDVSAPPAALAASAVTTSASVAAVPAAAETAVAVAGRTSGRDDTQRALLSGGAGGGGKPREVPEAVIDLGLSEDSQNSEDSAPMLYNVLDGGAIFGTGELNEPTSKADAVPREAPLAGAPRKGSGVGSGEGSGARAGLVGLTSLAVAGPEVEMVCQDESPPKEDGGGVPERVPKEAISNGPRWLETHVWHAKRMEMHSR